MNTMIMMTSLGLGGVILAGTCPPAEPYDPQVAVEPIRITLGVQAVPDELEHETCWRTAVEPKPLSEQVNNGLSWLIKTQQSSGGWGQGEESARMGRGMDGVRDKPNVGDTCAAGLALLRSGSTATEGLYADAIYSAVKFVLSEVEASDPSSLSVTSVQGTRLQAKIGAHIDTFLASLFLAEVKGHLPTPKAEQRVAAALQKIIDKLEQHQLATGGWNNQGWAPVLGQSVAMKGLNRARQMGAEVPQSVLDLSSSLVQGKIAGGGFGGGGADAAGVDLYEAAATVSGLQDAENTNSQEEDDLRQVADDPTAPADERDQAVTRLASIDESRRANETAQRAIVDRLDDKQFIAGFGSNGGEEFLSYMNIAESLVVKADDEWRKWDDQITSNLDRIQNDDGSWSGHHCITGRTFCTSAALLVLMADRTPVPMEAIRNAREADEADDNDQPTDIEPAVSDVAPIIKGGR